MTEDTKPILAQKLIADANLTVFVGFVVEAAQDGWSLDPAQAPDQYGYIYEAHMVKDESKIDKTPTRADILANARSAKKLKADKPVEAPVEAPAEEKPQEAPAEKPAEEVAPE